MADGEPNAVNFPQCYEKKSDYKKSLRSSVAAAEIFNAPAGDFHIHRLPDFQVE
jgi:hypothetical protein